MPVIASLLVGTALMAAVPSATALDVAAFPPDTPTSYRSECGTCHATFPPGLLAGDDWRTIMNGLSSHFGDNATLPESTRREIEDFLARNAGNPGRFGSRTDPPRVSSTTWFRRTHGAVRKAFRDPLVGSAANCDICHYEAAIGRFDRRAPIVERLARKE